MPVELADSYESLYRRAFTRMAVGRTDEAIELMLRIVNRLRRLRPETLERRPNLQGMLLTAWGSVVHFLRWEKRYDQAIAVCESVLDRLPSPDAGRRRIASLMIESGEVEGGLTRMRQVAEESPSYDSWTGLGAEYIILKRYDEAEACYQSALSLAGSNEEAAAANTSLFRVYRETDRVDRALSAWNMALVLDPDLAGQVYWVYAWLIERGDLEEAAKYLEREREPVRRTFYLGLLAWQAGEQDAARERWRDVLDMEVDEGESDVEAWMEAALRLGEPEKVIDLEGDVLVRSAPDSVEGAILMGIAYAMLDEVEDAAEWFDQATLRFQRAWPSRDKIPAEKWTLLTSLVSDEGTLQSVAAYFDVDDDEA